MNYKGNIQLLGFLLLMSVINIAKGQLSAPGNSATINTAYPAFTETDSIFIFCVVEEDSVAASLQVQTSLPGTKTFLWEKYNQATGSFESFLTDITEAFQSTRTGLENGGYRVTVTQGEQTEIYRGWVFNNLITANASITSSTCNSFTLTGDVTSSPLIYYDILNNAEVKISNNIQTEWSRGEEVIGTLPEWIVYSPPAENTQYSLRVYDQFGCEATSSVLYESIVPDAAFTASPMEGEAPLDVTFNNQSKNADPDLYEWFFYRDLDDIKRESETTQLPIDSIMTVAYNQNPVYTYENSGMYKVKMVAKRSLDSQTCVDTAYLQGYIQVDTSFVAVPNVFTPNGDGNNDMFIVKFWSMQSIKIQIFNRWGKRIHFYESSNVRGFDEVYTASVWDGRINNRFASPGVYYYIVEGRGRDNKGRRADGFFHLFRGKE
jgi:gliding motility-associated-like protein